MLYESAYVSLFIQIIVGIIDFLGLKIDIPKDKELFKDLLKVELGVQTVEFIFYLWMVYNLNKISNITPYRYLDWLITTPIMLITLSAYLDNKKYKNLKEYIYENKEYVIKIVSLNMLMLIFGLIGELNQKYYNTFIILGFIPFIIYFKIIYNQYIIKNISKDKIGLFLFFAIVWILYGIVAFFSYELKNTSYNILDLFSKNLFGLFLVYILWIHRIK